MKAHIGVANLTSIYIDCVKYEVQSIPRTLLSYIYINWIKYMYGLP